MVEARGTIRVAFDAHVVGRRQGGNERYAVELASALAARSDVDVLAYVDRHVVWPGSPPAPRTRELRFRHAQLRIPFELPYRARRDRAELLHVQFVAPPVTGVPVVVLIADLSFEDRPQDFRARTGLRLRALVPLSARRAAAIVVPSRWTRDRLLALYGIDPARVHVVPDGVSERWAGPDGDPARGPLVGVDLPPAFVLAVGRSVPRKNIPLLVRAVDEARRRGAGDLWLFIAGEPGPRGDPIDQATESVGGAAWVRRLGHVPDETLAALYATAAVVAYPSLYEGFGLPILEALAAGAVLVASDTTSIPEVAGDAAVLVDPTDRDALAEGLARAATDEVLRRRLREAGPRRAARFTWAATADATVKAYRAALSR